MFLTINIQTKITIRFWKTINLKQIKTFIIMYLFSNKVCVQF